jgi:hypothetical protein
MVIRTVFGLVRGVFFFTSETDNALLCYHKTLKDLYIYIYTHIHMIIRAQDANSAFRNSLNSFKNYILLNLFRTDCIMVMMVVVVAVVVAAAAAAAVVVVPYVVVVVVQASLRHENF